MYPIKTLDKNAMSVVISMKKSRSLTEKATNVHINASKTHRFSGL